jgi:hypothetical protein
MPKRPNAVSSFAIPALLLAASWPALAGAGDSSGKQAGQAVTAQQLARNGTSYVGKNITFHGKIDRVLGNGAYLVSDAGTQTGNRVIVLTTGAASGAGGGPGTTPGQSTQQRAGVAGQELKEGSDIQLQGKVEQLNVTNEVDTFSPKNDTETIRGAEAAVPVIVVQPGSIKARG